MGVIAVHRHIVVLPGTDTVEVVRLKHVIRSDQSFITELAHLIPIPLRRTAFRLIEELVNIRISGLTELETGDLPERGEFRFPTAVVRFDGAVFPFQERTVERRSIFPVEIRTAELEFLFVESQDHHQDGIVDQTGLRIRIHPADHLFHTVPPVRTNLRIEMNRKPRPPFRGIRQRGAPVLRLERRPSVLLCPHHIAHQINPALLQRKRQIVKQIQMMSVQPQFFAGPRHQKMLRNMNAHHIVTVFDQFIRQPVDFPTA